jgi:hypothetical protein
MAILSREAILEALKRDAHRVGDAPKLDARVRDGIEALRRDARRGQEHLEALKRDSRRFQEEMDAARGKLLLPRFQADIEALMRPQKEIVAFRRELEEAQATLAAKVRLWRTDPHFILLNPRSTLKQRRAAARRIAAAQPSMRFKRPAVRAALRGLPASERDRWLRQLFVDALVAAGKESATPLSRIRIGRRWVKDRQGRVCEHIAPLALSVAQGRRWLLQRARRLMELEILAGDLDSGQHRRRLSRRDREALGEDHLGVEAMLEYHPTPPATLRKRRLSKRERQLYDLLRAGVSSTEAAVRLKLSPSTSTVRVLKHRLRAKGWLKM